MNILIEIETNDPILNSELLERPQKIEKMTHLPAKAVFVKVQQSTEKERLLRYLLSFRPGVDGSLIANWLWSKINGRANLLRMDHLEVPIEKDEIEKIILAKLKSGSESEHDV